mgnify:CR=1 FL=1
MVGFERLVFALLVRAVHEAHAGRPDAQRFLAGETLALWADLLGIRPSAIRRAATDPGWPARYRQAISQYEAERRRRTP